VGGSSSEHLHRSDGPSYLIWKSDGDANGEFPGCVPAAQSESQLTGTPTLLLVNGGRAGRVRSSRALHVQVGSQYYLFYSGNNYDTSKYASATPPAPPLGPCSNVSLNRSSVQASGMSGPGGESFSPGRTASCSWPSPPSRPVGYENGGHRALYVATVGFADGLPYFDPTTAPLPMSGTGRSVGTVVFSSVRPRTTDQQEGSTSTRPSRHGRHP